MAARRRGICLPNAFKTPSFPYQSTSASDPGEQRTDPDGAIEMHGTIRDMAG
jgi:hypothetical protein